MSTDASLSSKILNKLHLGGGSSDQSTTGSKGTYENKDTTLVHPVTKTPMKATSEPLVNMDKTELAAEWWGTQDIVLTKRPPPMVTEPNDAIVRVTSTTICGSDLHMYVNKIPAANAMHKGDVPGHECVGVVEDVGPGVTKFKKGDRVVVSAVISCGDCDYCKKGFSSACDHTNPSGQMEYLYGHRCAALLGYSALTGAYSGGQAEFVRVPLANNNLLHIPQGLSDNQVLLLSDVLCTGWHGNNLAKVQKGDTVCVWGMGPVGMAAAYLALKLSGASRVIGIDCEQYRLDLAAKQGIEVLNFSTVDDVVEEIWRRIPGGPDCCIDCVGFRFPKSWGQKAMYHLGLATDAIDVVKEMIRAVRKCGRLALIGDYFANANAFPIGIFMEKGLSMAGGQLFCQTYWEMLMSKIVDGTIDPLFLITHEMPFSQISEAYSMFNAHDSNVMKISLKTAAGEALKNGLDVFSVTTGISDKAKDSAGKFTTKSNADEQGTRPGYA